MRQQARAIAVGLPVLLSVPAGAQVIFSDDFSGGDDSQWTRLDLIGGTDYSVTGGRYEIESVPLPPLPMLAATGAGIADSVANPHLYTHGRFRASVRMNNAATNVTLVGRTDPTGASGYALAMNNFEDLIGIAILPNPENVVWMSYPVTEGVDYLMEATFFGSHLSLKVWEAGGVEPALPQLTLNDSTWSGSGIAALAVYNTPEGGTLSGSFDDVSFTVPAPGAAAIALGGLLLTRRRGEGRTREA